MKKSMRVLVICGLLAQGCLYSGETIISDSEVSCPSLFPLCRVDDVIHATTYEELCSQYVERFTLFVGIISHAFNTMSSAPNRLLNKGFIPMLCHCMKKLIEVESVNETDADKKALYVSSLKLVGDIQKYSANTFGGVTWLLSVQIEELCKQLKTYVQTVSKSKIALNYLALLNRFHSQCPSTESIKAEIDKDPAFEECMRAAHADYQSLKLVQPISPLLVLQEILYKAVLAAGKKEWLGFVHYYMRGVLKDVEAKQFDGISKSFLWVEYTPLTVTDFFSSPEFLDCMTYYFKEVVFKEVVFDEDVPLVCSYSKLEDILASDKDAYGKLKEEADMQYDSLCEHGHLFMRKLLVAFSAFEERLTKK